MSPSPAPFATFDPIGSDEAAIARLRSCAIAVRSAADEIDRTLADLRAFDRPDVWQGARATAFRHELQDRFTLLSALDHGASAHLRDAAQRIETRADALHTAAERAVIDDLRGTAPIEPWFLPR